MSGHPTGRAAVALASAALLASLAVAATAAPAVARPTCAGKPATLVGDAKANVLRGTPRQDVIVARGGNDRIYGRGGNDIICADRGKDTVFGGGGKDRIYGGPQNDVLKGGPGWDRIDGGGGTDACYAQGGGGKTVRCELPARTLVIAYSDLDGSHTFNTGDVLISKIVDTNQDDTPSPGDTVVMGRYPTTLTPTSAAHFKEWGVKRHTITDVPLKTPSWVQIETAGGTHNWLAKPGEVDEYMEYPATPGVNESMVQDGLNGSATDILYMSAGSQSQPGNEPTKQTLNSSDDRLIDVELLY